MTLRRRLVVPALALCFAAGLLVFRTELRRWAAESALLRAPAPEAEALAALLETHPDRVRFLRSLWETRRIPHRSAALAALRERPELIAGFLPELRAAVLDPDFSTREGAMGLLRQISDPHLPIAIAWLLGDADPHSKLLALNAMDAIAPAESIPLLIPLLDDIDPRVVATASVKLERMSGVAAPLRILDVVGGGGDSGESTLSPEAKDKLAGARAVWRDWWAVHRAEYPPAPAPPARPPPVHLHLGEATLERLEGGAFAFPPAVGKPVLVNFWTTWCSACLVEIPSLVELAHKHGDKLAILGVSLDVETHTHDDDGGEGHAEHSHGEITPELRRKIERAAKKLGVNYPILIDGELELSARGMGGELPTNILLDRQGRVVRRFVGARSLAAWEAMLAEVW